MKIKDKLKYALKHLRHRRLRTWLTVLSIVIGIVTIMLLIGLSEGLKANVDRQISQFDPRTIVVIPMNVEKGGASFLMGGTLRSTSGKLFEKDAEKIKGVDGVEIVAKSVVGRAYIEFKDKRIEGSVIGVEPVVFTKTTTVNIEEGRFLDEGDRGVAVLGYDIAKDSFDREIKVGDRIKIGSKTFRVVGILEKTGNSFFNVDQYILVNYEDGRDLFKDNLLDKEISAIRITIAEGYDVDEVAEEIEFVLMNLHKVSEDDKDFSVISPKFVKEQTDSVINILSVFMGAVAAISLVIGAIGISNSMVMAVMERKREVGVLKSLGATSKEIEQMFLIESSLISVVGGIVGVLLSIIIGYILTYHGIETIISPLLILVSLVVSTLVGAIAGIFPARMAAAVPPTEALRYE